MVQVSISFVDGHYVIASVKGVRIFSDVDEAIECVKSELVEPKQPNIG